jgi:hypothetical protein
MFENCRKHFNTLFCVHYLDRKKRTAGEISVGQKEELVYCQADKTLAMIIELSSRQNLPGELQDDNGHIPVLDNLDI